MSMTSVLQKWVMELPLREQGTLLTGRPMSGDDYGAALTCEAVTDDPDPDEAPAHDAACSACRGTGIPQSGPPDRGRCSWCGGSGREQVGGEDEV